MEMRQVSEALSAVWREMFSLGAFFDDPITRASGCADEFAPQMFRDHRRRATEALSAHGFTVQEFLSEVESRVSAKWFWESGLAEFLDPTPQD